MSVEINLAKCQMKATDLSWRDVDVQIVLGALAIVIVLAVVAMVIV